ncbi:haloacid dehalogenase [Marinobacterium zhoushanense]|uniref:(S)-2-haloacid dehalogenase n=1 Tax=Marinobacterium zhoushanense TaxID=1679163 RepID=A0ABQ1K164_9GAMM|nr:haloacid dehalogenase type II [Marinobacterium zhoushanense]GGB81682.1 haloacid dehalogenase [Marinobacterium zhoushanense]
MPYAIGFDVYGTLVDPVAMGTHLQGLAGDQARAFGQLWHEKKVEYAFRRALMEQYQDFGTCTRQALEYCLLRFGLNLSDQDQQRLMEKFGQLPAFADVITGLEALRKQGHTLVAFSNGPEAAVRGLLHNADVLPLLHDVISVDALRTYKPSPRVYRYLMRRTDGTPEHTWMVSSNPWDVIGAKCAGLKAVWVQRDPASLFDPWDVVPDMVVKDLVELSKRWE